MFRYIVYLIFLVFISSSCKVLMPSEMFKTEKDHPIADFQPSEKEYKIKPFDKLSIMITTNDGFRFVDAGVYGGGGGNNNVQQGLEYTVEYDGLIKLPTLGRIKIDGYTPKEAEALLEKEYAKYYQAPFVLIKVTNRKVFIFTENGTNAQVIEISEANLTLIEAIAQTGGLTSTSKSYRIKLVRGDLNNNPKVFIYNIYKLKDIEKANLLLEANDIIYIESRPQYVNQILNEVSPYLTLISTFLLIVGYSSLF